MRNADESSLKKQIVSASPEDLEQIEAELHAIQFATQSTLEQKAILQRLTQQTAAWIIGRSVRFIADHQPARNADGSYDGPQLLAWMIARERADAVEKAAADGGQESAKARILEAKALQEELEAAKAQGKLVDREQVHTFLASLASTLRQAGDKLQKEFGREALEILNDAIDTTARMMKEEL